MIILLRCYVCVYDCGLYGLDFISISIISSYALQRFADAHQNIHFTRAYSTYHRSKCNLGYMGIVSFFPNLPYTKIRIPISRLLEVSATIVLYVDVNPIPVGRHTAINTRKVLLLKERCCN